MYLVNIGTSNYGGAVVHNHQLGVDVDHEPAGGWWKQCKADHGSGPYLRDPLSTSAWLPGSMGSREGGSSSSSSRATGVRSTRWSWRKVEKEGMEDLSAVY